MTQGIPMPNFGLARYTEGSQERDGVRCYVVTGAFHTQGPVFSAEAVETSLDVVASQNDFVKMRHRLKDEAMAKLKELVLTHRAAVEPILND